jgi:hypothetical protein
MGVTVFEKGKTRTVIRENIQYELHIVKAVRDMFDSKKIVFKKGEHVEINETCAKMFAGDGKLQLTPAIFTPENSILKKFKKKNVHKVTEVKLDLKVKQPK